MKSCWSDRRDNVPRSWGEAGWGLQVPWLSPNFYPWKCLPSPFLCGSMPHPHSFFSCIFLLGCMWSGHWRTYSSSRSVVVLWHRSQIFSHLLICFVLVTSVHQQTNPQFFLKNNSLSERNCEYFITYQSLEDGGICFASFPWAILSSWKNLLGTSMGLAVMSLFCL